MRIFMLITVLANFFMGLAGALIENWRGFAISSLTILVVGVIAMIRIQYALEDEHAQHA